MADTGDQGFGIAVTFSSGFLAKIRGVRLAGYRREPIETTHAKSTNGWRTFIPSDIKGGQTIEVDLLFQPDATPPLTDSAETCTITYPVPSGLSNGATLAQSGFLIEFGNEAPYDDVMTATATIQLTGEPTWTDAS